MQSNAEHNSVEPYRSTISAFEAAATRLLPAVIVDEAGRVLHGNYGLCRFR